MEINYTCSLGSLCHSSQILKKNKLKKCSYPFDWIFSDCNIIIHCIEDDFKIFLDKSYYKSMGKNRCIHLKYTTKIFKDIWRHHNPLNNEKDYNYYVRCVSRFRQLLQYEEKKLFIMIFVNGEHESHDNKFKKKIIEFNSKLSNYTKNYILLVIIHFPKKTYPHHIFTYNDNIHFLELYTISLSNGVKFNNNIDNKYLNNIINKTYNFNIK